MSYLARLKNYAHPESEPTKPTKPGFVGFVGPVPASAQEIGLAEALAAAINRACDVRGDDDANRAGLLRECAELTPEAQADLLAHFTIEAARWAPAEPDGRVTCQECRHYRPRRCGNHKAAGLQGAEVSRDLAALRQHCPGFTPRAAA